MASSEIQDHGWLKVRRELNKLQAHNVNVGILSDKGSQTVEGGDTLAEVAAYNEFGTEHIPERPAHRDTFDKTRAGFKKRLAGIVGLIVEGKISYETGLERMGIWYANELKQAIINWSDPPNAPSTVRKKGANNPLIDTGRTVNSIDYEIVKE